MPGNEPLTTTEMESNLSSQIQEIEALKSIYGEDFLTETDGDGRNFSIMIHVGEDEGQEATLVITFTDEYPSKSPPVYALSIPWVRGQMKQEYCLAIEEIYSKHPGQPIVYDWVEKLRELLHKNKPETLDAVMPDSDFKVDVGNSEENQDQDIAIGTEIDIFTGEPITDRKSTFQAHAASIKTIEDVKQVLGTLYRNKKIRSATHNMFAYRIYNEVTQNYIQDCQDDGETHAGSRLLHLLQILDCRDCCVVVSRWYGGVMLYGDRFKHINRVARDILDQKGFIRSSSTTSGKSN